MTVPGLPVTLRPVEVLASGSLTTVLRCRRRAGPDVVVKAVRPGTTDSHLAIATLRTEALVRSTVRHPAILPLERTYDSPAGPLLVGPFLPDGTLESRLGAALSLTTAFSVIDAIAGAVEALHAAGWVHGDLNGANVLCDWSAWRWLLADFGAARPIGAHAGSVRQLPGTACPPEAWRDEPASPATDVFALAHLVDRCLPAVRPAAVITILRRGTATDPTRRPAGAAELAAALHRAWPANRDESGSAGTAVPPATPPGGTASVPAAVPPVAPGVPALARRLDALAADLSPGERRALHDILRRAEWAAAAATAALTATTVTVFGRAEALATFEEVGLAHALAEATEGPPTADRLAGRCGLAVEPTRVVLDLMVSLGLVTRHAVDQDPEYRLAPSILPLYAGDTARINRPVGQARRLWADLAHWLNTGTAPVPMDGDPSGAGYRDAAAVLGAASRTASTVLATALARDGHLASATRIVDIGAGSGVWSRALHAVVPLAELVLVDRLDVLSAHRFADLPTHRDPVRLVAADWRALPLARTAFDAVVLANACHLEDADGAAKLICAASALLRPGGQLLIVDAVGDPTDEGTLLQSMHLGIRTRRGRVHPRASYRLWCDRAGLRPAGEYVLPSGFTALVETVAGPPSGSRSGPRRSS